MSNAKTVGWLLVGIAAVVAVHLALDVHSDQAPRTLRRNVLVPSADKATSLTVARLGDAAVTRLAKDDGWRIVEPCAVRAEERIVLGLTDALSFAPISDEMTLAELLRLGRTRSDFELDRPRLVVTVGEAGKEVVVTFGKATPSGDGVYATVGESETVFVVPTNVYAAADHDVTGFRRRSLFALMTDDVTSFDVVRGEGRFLRFIRDREMWRLAEPRESVASTSRVRGFLDALVALEAQTFVWPVAGSNETGVASVSLLAGYGLDPESALTVTLKCSDGSDHAVSFGREAGNGDIYALAQGDNAIVTVPAAVRDLALSGETTFVDTRLFPLEPSAVNVLALDDEGSVCLLSRGADGQWRLDAPVSAPANADAADALLARLLSLRHSDVIENGVRVSVGTNAEPFTVSRQALLAGFRLDDLRSCEIVKLDPKVVKRVVVTDVGKKPVSVLLDSDHGSWTIESAEASVVADGEAVTRLLTALNPLKAARVARLRVTASELGNFGLDKPFRTVAVDLSTTDSIRRNVLIGDLTDGGRFATLGSSDAVFVISPEQMDALLAPIAK